MISGNEFMIKYLGIIFILVGIIRYNLPTARKIELTNLGLPNCFDYIILIILNNYNKISSEFSQVWTYQPTSISVVFHFTYIIMIIRLILNLK